MSPLTEPTQAAPAPARTTRSAPATAQGGVLDRFGNALAQAMALPEPTAVAAPVVPGAMATPASPAPTQVVKGQPLANALPALPDGAAKPEPHLVAGPSKPAGDEPEAPATEAEQDKPSADAAKPLEGPQPSAPSQATPPQAAPIVAQPGAAPSEAGGAAPSMGEDGSATAVAGVDGRQPSSAPATAAQAAAPAAAQILEPSATTPPSHASAPPGANDPAVHAAQGRRSAVTAEKEPTAATPAPADAAPFPAIALAVPPNAAPAPVGVAPHPAPAPSQASPRPSTAGEPAPPSAAVQVGPVLASFAASAAHPGAPQHLTIRLDPLDLGRVQVHIERLPDGSARVDLKVEKPDTLLLLLRDQPQLHRALDLAGVPSTKRTLQFHLAPPDPTPSNAASPGGMAAQSNADQGHGQQRPGQPHFGRFAAHGPASSLGEPIPGPAGFRRAGVDITA